MPKPNVPVVSRRDYECRSAAFSEASDLVKSLHYSGSAGNTSTLTMGLYRKGDTSLLGAALWQRPMRPAANYVARLYGVPADSVISLSRLVVAPAVPQNGASFLIGAALRELRRDPRFLAAITWADNAQGHDGRIYRATNWDHTGKTRPRKGWVDAEGNQRSPRVGPSRARRNLSKAECIALGWRQTQAAGKDRYCLRL